MDAYMEKLCGIEGVYALVEELAEVIAVESRRGPTTFGDCLKTWVEDSHVIEAVGGDPSTYLLVVLLTLAKFHEDPEFFDESAAEAITKIFELGKGGRILPEALDPYKWKEWVFRRQCGLPLQD